jgi:twitching motility protein PilT
MNTISAQQAMARFVSALPAEEQRPARDRLGRMIRYVVSQRLVPRKQDEHRTGVFEVWKSGEEPLEGLLRSEPRQRAENGPSHKSATTDDLSIDSQIEDLVRAGIVTAEIALTHAMDPRALAKKLGLSDR